MSVAELSARLSELEGWLEKKRVEQEIPGMAVAVVVSDDVVLLKGFGVADLDTGRAVDERTLFSLGSCTKTFTAVLAAIAADSGAIRWDDPVSKHLPGFEVQLSGAPPGTQVTLQDVFSHLTGIGRLARLWADRPTPLEEVLAAVKRQAPVAAYRSRWEYSNVMYAAGGAAVARSLGEDWHTSVRARLLEPLGMQATHTWQAESREDPALAQGYTHLMPGHRPMPWIDRQGVAPAGGIDSTAADMSRWMRFLVAGGSIDETRIVTSEELERLWIPQVQLAPDVSYATGWFIHDWEGRRVIDHAGNGDNGFFCQVALMPDHDMGFVLLANVKQALLQWEALKGVFAILEGEEPPELKKPG